MPEVQEFYSEVLGLSPNAWTTYPIMRDRRENELDNYVNGDLYFLNYYNTYKKLGGNPLYGRNIQLLAVPDSIFPKRILSGSQVWPGMTMTQMTTLHPLNPEGTFNGEKFKWYGTLQQIRIPASYPLTQIVQQHNWIEGGYGVTDMETEPVNADYKESATVARSLVDQTRVNRQMAVGTGGDSVSISIDGSSAFSMTPQTTATSQWVVKESNKKIVPSAIADTDSIKWSQISWNEQGDATQEITRTYPKIMFPLLMAPQYKPWMCCRLLTIKMKVSLEEWFNIWDDLSYRLNTMFWHRQNNDYQGQYSMSHEWDRATSNSILAKPNPYGGTFKICKNKKVFINPFKGKTIINRIYSKKRSGKIIKAKMWQAGQKPLDNDTDAKNMAYGYYQNALYISMLLMPINLYRDFDAFTAQVLRKYFVADNGDLQNVTKGTFYYQQDKILGEDVNYIMKVNGAAVPNSPGWLYNTPIPVGIKLWNKGDILIKTRTRYSEY